MRHPAFIFLVAGIAAAAGGAVSVAAPALPITTAPVISGPSTTRPAPLTVLLTPFKSLGDSSRSEWIGPAIEEELASDLNRNSAVRVVRSPTTGPSADGLNQARQAGAQRLVVGSYQVVDDQVRINGEVVDPDDGKSVGHLRVTGARRDLFKLEDNLAAELSQVLPRQDESDQSFTVTPVASDGMMGQPAQPVFVQGRPSDAAADDPYAGAIYPTNPNIGYGPDVGYGGFTGYGYGYGYPYFGSPLFVYVRGGHEHSGYRDGNRGEGGGYGFYGPRNGIVGGGPIVPTRRVPTEREPTFPSGAPRSPGPASVTPSHGFVGPQGPASESRGAAGGGGRR